MAGKLDGFLDTEEATDAPPETIADVAAAKSAPIEEVIEAPEPAPAVGERVPTTSEEVLEPDVPAEPSAKGMIPREAFVAARNDWKGKADRLEGRLTELQAQMEALTKQVPQQAPAYAPPPQAAQAPVPYEQAFPPPDRNTDPVAFYEWKRGFDRNTQMNVTEQLLASKVGEQGLREKLEAFKSEMSRNPLLKQALDVHPDPVRFAYEQGVDIIKDRAEQARRDALLKDVGDPDAWREAERAKIRAEIEAQWMGTATPAAPAAPVNLPTSLATARSAAPRVTVQEIPESFGDILKSRRRQV